MRTLQHAMRFPLGRKKAFTLSYDDGVTQDIPFIDLLRRLNLKATFNINSGHLGQKDFIIREGRRVEHDHIRPEEVQSLYDGFEVALHTVSHPALTLLDDAQVLCQVLQDKDALEKLVGYPVRGMAYPGGVFSARIIELLKGCGVRFCREVAVTHDFSLPKEALAWQCSCHHWDLEALIEPFLAEHSGFQPYLLSVWGHSFEFDQRDDWAVIENQLKRLSGHSDVWYAANIEIFDYIDAYNALKWTVQGDVVSNPSALEVWVWLEGAGEVCIPAGQCVHLSPKAV